MIYLLTGTAFDAPKRLNHREDGVALEFPSSAGSRARGLLALRAQNWRASGGAPKPYDYEVEWLESDGNQCVVTDVIQASPNVTVRAKIFRTNNTSPESDFIGNYRGQGNGFAVGYAWNTSIDHVIFCFKQGTINVIVKATDLESPVDVEAYFRSSDKTMTVNGVSGSSNCNNLIPSANGNICLFARGNAYQNPFYGRIYSGLTYSEDGFVKLHAVMCVKDGVPCVYDSVNDKFYYNTKSSAPFVAGPRI